MIQENFLKNDGVNEWKVQLRNYNHMLLICYDSELTGLKIRIQNVSEEIIFAMRLTAKKHEFEVNVSTLNQGVYWVILHQSEVELRRATFQIF